MELYHAVFVYLHSVGFSEVPLAQTVLLNSVAVSFTCVSTPDFQAFEILWSINGQAVEFEQTPPIVQIRNVIDENTGALSSTLIVPTMLMYDNACMVCTLVSEGETSMSDPALLKLQCKYKSMYLQLMYLGTNLIKASLVHEYVMIFSRIDTSLPFLQYSRLP